MDTILPLLPFRNGNIMDSEPSIADSQPPVEAIDSTDSTDATIVDDGLSTYSIFQSYAYLQSNPYVPYMIGAIVLLLILKR